MLDAVNGPTERHGAGHFILGAGWLSLCDWGREQHRRSGAWERARFFDSQSQAHGVSIVPDE